MVLLDIFVPALDRRYDMSVDETAKVSMIIEEMANVICQKEQCTLEGPLEEMCLADCDKRIFFMPDRCLDVYGVKNGDKLILV